MQRGAYILAVQTPTMWMDKGDGTYNSDIVGEKQVSKYEKDLFAAIEDYVKSNKDIDTDRIYLGGCSNGGYMTMNLMFEHGDYFAAYYPICEAYMNVNISEDMIKQVKDYKIWFVQSEDDTTVDPLSTTIPTYYRLLKAGAKNIHFTLYDQVRGTDDPNAIYMGHYSWVYAFNDQVDKEFDNAKILEDYDNITIEEGKLTSSNNYLTNANCNKEANMWTWLSEQTKATKEEEAEETGKGAVDAQMVVMGYEWGPAVPKVIVEFDDKVSGFSKNTFTVKTGESERVILDVYNSDKDGKKEKSATKYLTFELKVNTIEMFGMTFGDANPFTYDMETGRNSWATEFNLELALADSKTFKVGKTEYTSKNAWTYKKNLIDNYVVPETADWKKDTFKMEGSDITLHRASFTPEGAETDSVKNPLIIWLHGAGEGGNDTDITLLGNEVVALAKEGIQKYFTNDMQRGAYILAVQTPTMWMDKGDGTYNSDIVGEKQVSKYEKDLFAAIEDYVKSNKDIDTDRIYLGGCSNGGYMTMNLMFEHGDYFAAYYPICEAYMNVNISEDMIKQVKDYKIWFVQSEDDTTVDPLSTTIPTYYRLLKAGAKNIHFTLYDQVRGTDDPNAIYMGHYSWVYAFNDQVKKEFDNSKILEDYDNITIEEGKFTSSNNYLTNANCNKKANMWSWLAQQKKEN
eukprot:jgi/Orpsp1_1/1178612/evm.model.c7180000066037.2